MPEQETIREQAARRVTCAATVPIFEPVIRGMSEIEPIETSRLHNQARGMNLFP